MSLPHQCQEQLTHQYSPQEEMANAISHGIGAFLSIIALIILTYNAAIANDVLRITSFAIYGISLVMLFTASTLYHALKEPKAKLLFKLFDHCAIYLLIAGTYTPLMLITLNGLTGYVMLIIVWLLAFAGIIFKIRFGNKYKIISVASYLGMGLISLVCIKPLYLALKGDGLLFLCLGGLFYSLGIIFYLNKRIPFNHAIWHLFVLAGAISHFSMVWYYV